MQNCFDVGIYTRLSRDDNNGNLESMSIGNQKQILIDYVKEKGWNLAEIYIDDGYSGTNFDRPDFKRLVKDIEKCRINCVITKDLSRLGRNYSMTGYYTDEYFPEKNVRYIAINDGVDTMGNNNDFAAFHNVINEYYPRDISRKVRQVKKSNAAKGMFMGSRAPYGYKKSPSDKHVLIIDEDVAHIVRRIFHDVANGENGRRIAEQLNQDGVLSPIAYYYQSLDKNNPRKDESMVWGSTSVLNIIENRAYAGDLVQGRRQVVSFKSKKKRKTDPEEWIIVENTHEPIVSRDLWDESQKMRKSRTPFRTPKVDRDVSIFAGLVKCADCGSTMAASLRGREGKQKLTYRCGRYANHGKEICSSHNIREEILEEIVLNDICKYAKQVENDKQALIDQIISAMKKETAAEGNMAEKQLHTTEQKIEEINYTVKSLYKEKMSGKMPETFFYSLLSDYKKELESLEDKLPSLRDRVIEEKNQEQNVVHWTNSVSKYLKIQKLDRSLARELIDSIIVSELTSVDGKSSQDITINYKFVGNLQKFFGKEKNAA
ncbi:MAG: hypothetical protein BGN88_12655 [Clostridiales bacterium 43-6]|nr:MAG: hypothetical protein BGN88_12655 [Clostridiales bacterium 43-6]